jgi:hypothetical protein
MRARGTPHRDTEGRAAADQPVERRPATRTFLDHGTPAGPDGGLSLSQRPAQPAKAASVGHSSRPVDLLWLITKRSVIG